MSISSKDIIPVTRARAKLAELCDEVKSGRKEKILTKNGESWAALIGAARLHYYHQLEQEHVHLTLLQEALLGVEDVGVGKVISVDKLRAKYGRR